jgi:Uma2 family endonuclease
MATAQRSIIHDTEPKFTSADLPLLADDNKRYEIIEDDDVAPDLVWISHERLAGALDESRHFRVAPELVIEVLSPGKVDEERDRKAKLKLYSRRGVQEYWIVDWITQQVEIYRRVRRRLHLVETLLPKDKITSPLLPGFACQVSALFFTPPRSKNPL